MTMDKAEKLEQLKAQLGFILRALACLAAYETDALKKLAKRVKKRG